MQKTALESLSLAYRLLNPGSVVLVSVGDGERDNLFPVSWNMPVGDDPPLAALLSSREHFSFPFIERTGELALNVPCAEIVDALYGCGKTSGSEVPDKFARFGLHRETPSSIRVPLVAEAVANLECRVERILDVEGCGLILARVVAARAASEHFRDGDWQFDRGLQLIHHLAGNRFCVSEGVREARRP
jgi:flavin reductase (DIM6/NTAB) family NADH-FMN oxidoreductase RutF